MDNKDSLPPNSPPEKLVQQFLENQSKEVALKEKELELKAQEDRDNLEFAKATLATKERITESLLKKSSAASKYRYSFIAFIVLIFAGLIIAGFAFNRVDVFP